ncbi:Dyp-type peroxidase [Jeongeupia naejangsanensis]|uniref:Dyp-type peroxidase n=1 Tax=Jeongeupia naejangsanensis TaxID=613195 RepID=A0ABS2BPT1_9NEIS|nr:Dyp-type peroxidase [Jeongeupia naejangsanensis]MBM3117645.1 Dyp-type peroxidase [Jeongeupia naejangsanensis]
MTTPQSGILPLASSHAYFVLLRRRLGRRIDAKSRECLANLQARLAAQDCLGVVAFGADAFGDVFDGPRPAELRAFPRIPGAVHAAPASDADVLIHLRGEHQDRLFDLADACVDALSGWLEPVENVAAFRRAEGRDLTGFVDGTENPDADERPTVALVADGDWAGGSYIHTQRYVHRLDTWQKLPVKQQEAVMGRTKADDEELDDEEKPATAHISRVVIEENGEELAILRHSLPYGTPGGERGLYFASYCHTPVIFEKMLARMISPTSDGRVDHLLNYTRAVSGGAFFAPSREKLAMLG